MKVLLRSLVIFLINLPLVLAEEVSFNALQWLEHMSAAMKTINYQGTVVFMKNGLLDTMKYRHNIVDGVEQEQLISLNTPLREVVRKNNEVSCFYKETNQKVINHHPVDTSLLINLPQDLRQLTSLYELSSVGKEAIAMRPTEIISIQAKDQFRYNRKIWLDSANYLPLKVEVYNLDGSILEQLVFTDLRIEASQEPVLTEVSNQPVQIKHIHSSQAEPFENAGFILKNLPSGFKSLFFIRNSMQQSQKAVDHLLLSDGFSSVSVYMEPKEANAVEGIHTLGSVNSYSRVLENYQLTVLGEVPAKTVEFIGSGITLH